MSETLQLTDERGKSSGRNWSEEEKNLVWEQVSNGKNEGLPLTECFRKISQELLPNRSEAAIGMLYYNVLRKEREHIKTSKSAPKIGQTKPEPKFDSDIIEAFQGLPEYIDQLHKRIDQLEKKVTHPSKEAIITAIIEICNSFQEKDSVLEVQEENRQLREKVEQLEQAYDDALGIYDMFTNMASISQIMSLGDFKQQMKTTLDQWGNVLDISFERAEIS